MRPSRLLIALVCLIASPSSAANRSTDLRIEDVEILGIYRTSFGDLAVARTVFPPLESPRGDSMLFLRVGDQLTDGRVAWIGFLSPRLAVVRLKQRVWPPDGRKPYREVLRVLGWDSISDPDAPSARPEFQPPPDHPPILQVTGPEGLGSWPEGRYSNPREIFVEVVDGQRLPAVDLFAAVFYEIYGSFPWRHESWRPGGWKVEKGFPVRGSILGLKSKERSRDPFRSLLAPWALWGPSSSSRPSGWRGLSIDEISSQAFEAFYETAEGRVAEAAFWDSILPWTLREGDRLWDGEVLSIVFTDGRWYNRCGKVTFRQVVDDPLALKPSREVVKIIAPPNERCD